MIARGTVHSAAGATIEASLPGAVVGAGTFIATSQGALYGVVTALHGERAIVDVLNSSAGIACGDPIAVDPRAMHMKLGTMLLGRTIDARGGSLDARRSPAGVMRRIDFRAPLPAERRGIRAPFWTGIRAIDGLLTAGRGARLGFFGSPGCGKSTLLHGIAANARADAVVIALTGERGREAEEWMRAAPPHATLVIATSDRSAAERTRCAQVAMAQAHALRSRGLHVLLVIDSIARYAYALRENAIAAGEPAGRGGFPASVFAALARYVESAGCFESGSITMIASVLCDGDDRDPVSEAVRSLLDGHIQLSAALAQSSHFPAISVVQSTARTMRAVVGPEHAQDAAVVRAAIAALERTADARSLGIPVDKATQPAVECEDELRAFLCQGPQAAAPAETLESLARLADRLR